LALGDVPAIEVTLAETAVPSEAGVDVMAILAWVLAGLAAIGLAVIVWLDMARSRTRTETEPGALATEPVRNKR
jgi:hypothetical protein